MALQKYGFIVKSPDLNLFTNHSQIATDNFNMMICGVPDAEHANYAAQEMLTKGVQLIELCGSFTAQEAQAIRDSIKDLVPVGFVQYTDDERARIKQELS
ncbi:MAG: hypothetical protein ACI9ES_001074 [Oceanospirillaceae bacterium]|jgi:hypothetical protein